MIVHQGLQPLPYFPQLCLKSAVSKSNQIKFIKIQHQINSTQVKENKQNEQY